jgi:hypothetical protein
VLDGFVMKNETPEQLLDRLADSPRVSKEFLAAKDWTPFLPILEGV